MKLFVYKTVKCEVINVKFFSGDLPLNNFVIMVNWKCMKLLYSSNWLCRIDSKLKKVIRLKHLMFEISYTFFSIFSWFFISLSSYHLCFQVLTITAFPFLVFPTFPFLCLCFTALKQKIFKNIFSIDLMLFQVKPF